MSTGPEQLDGTLVGPGPRTAGGLHGPASPGAELDRTGTCVAGVTAPAHQTTSLEVGDLLRCGLLGDPEPSCELAHRARPGDEVLEHVPVVEADVAVHGTAHVRQHLIAEGRCDRLHQKDQVVAQSVVERHVDGFHPPSVAQVHNPG